MVLETPTAANPLAIAQVVARNIVPLVGILVFGWPAINILLLYFADTMLAMGVMFAGLASYFGRQSTEDGVAARINSEAGAIAVAVFVCAFIAVPLGMPLVFVGAYMGWDGFAALARDPSFLGGLACQAVAAIWSYWGLWQELQHRTPDDLRLKRRFGLVMLRWLAVLIVVYSPIGWVFGRFLPFVLVAVYIGASIFAEIAPDKFLRAMPGGAADPDPPASPPPKRYSRTKKPR